ncbi:hypothetical protein [Antrihabitans stalactiti]|uniref:hypothetical protein n=1 Tax=Antrihabitans stalactiti TaxID=2584121 RepID=UPI0030B81C88
MGRALAIAVCALVLLCAPAAADPRPQFDNFCTPAIPGLEELSGMAAIGDKYYALGDSGTDDKLAVLDGNCGLVRWLNVPVDPYDTEDVAAFEGQLWLSDTGDNLRRRDTVSLTSMSPDDGSGELHRLTYPDGKHDAEALLIEPAGRPLIVTKEFSGPAGIYVPTGDTRITDLPSPGPAPLQRVGQVDLRKPTATGQTGPSPLVTGGAVSADGTVIALRTYSDVFLFAVPGGDFVKALTTGTPVVVTPRPQPQGESVTFTPAGDLLVGSETGGDGKPFPPLQILRGATALVAPVAAPHEREIDTGPHTWIWVAGVGSAVVIGGVVGAFALRRRRKL